MFCASRTLVLPYVRCSALLLVSEKIGFVAVSHLTFTNYFIIASYFQMSIGVIYNCTLKFKIT